MLHSKEDITSIYKNKKDIITTSNQISVIPESVVFLLL